MKPQFFRKILNNGMTIILEKRDLPIVSVAFAVRQGGVNESANEKGISHFIEHMLYKGTPTRDSKKIATEIEKNGGELNGFTDEEITAYWCRMPSKHLDVALNVLSDMIKNPLFDEKELKKERQVIFEEIKMYKDNPRLHVFDKIHGFLYEKPLGIPLIGTHETMNSIDRKKMLEKFNEVYKPNNMILCVVGDADFNYIVNFVEKNFSNEKGKIQKLTIQERNEQQIEKRKGIDQANLVFAYHVPKSNDKESYAAEVLTAITAGGMSSRLFSEIREKRNLAYAVKGGSNINKEFAYNFIYIGTMKDHVENVKNLILEEFKKIIKELDEKELNEAKEQLIGNHQISMEDSQSQMAHLLSDEISGNAEEFYEFEKNIKKVTIEQVKAIAKKAIEKYSFYALVPED